MGSPISFSGFNNIDFGTILNLIMQQERAPVTALESQKASLEAQDSSFATFATRLGALEEAARNLAEADSMAGLAADSSDEAAVGVSAGSGTIEGSYDVVVSQLARAQVLTSQTSYTSVDEVVATAGTISLALAGHPPVLIPITGPMTLAQLAEAINAQGDAPVTASVVQVSPGNYKLVLTGRSTGTANAFTVEMTDPLSGGTGLTFADSDSNGVYGDSPADNAQSAADALLTVNSVAIVSSSNTVNDVIPGVSLTLRAADPAKTVNVTVSRNFEEAAGLVEKFVAAYNDIVTFLNDQSTAAASGKTSIARDPLVIGFRDAIRSALMQSYGGGDLTRLAEAGIGFDRTGKMIFEKDLFEAALVASPADVQALFAGAGGSGGAFDALTDLVKGYTQSGGLVASLRERLDQQVSRLDERIAALEAQLARRRESLQQEFIAADRAMSQLTAQGASLAQLSGQYRLF